MDLKELKWFYNHTNRWNIPNNPILENVNMSTWGDIDNTVQIINWYTDNNYNFIIAYCHAEWGIDFDKFSLNRLRVSRMIICLLRALIANS